MAEFKIKDKETGEIFTIREKAQTSSNQMFLPGQQKVEKLISRREDALPRLVEELKTPMIDKEHPFKSAFTSQFKPAVTAMKTLAVPFQRAEAGLASAGLETQKQLAEPTPVLEKNPAEILKKFVQGVTGKRQAEFGDIIRTTGIGGDLNEVIAAPTGFLGAMGMANAMTKGLMVSSFNKGKEFLKSKMPQIMTKDYALNRAKVADQGLKELSKGLSGEYEATFGKIGRKMVDMSKAQAIVNEMPQPIINKIAKDNLMSKYKDGSLHPVVENLKRMRDIIRKSVPDNVWNGRMTATPEQHFMKEAYYKIGDMMAEGNPDLVALNSRYKDFMNMRDEVGSVIYDRFGNVKSKGLENLFKPGAERNKQIFFQKFAKMYPEAKQIITDMVKFNKRQAFKMTAKKALPWIPVIAGGGYMGSKLLSKLGQSAGIEER